LTKNTSLKNEIHAAGVSGLTIVKVILLPHFQFCSFILWMPTLLWMHGVVTLFDPSLYTPLGT